MEQPYNSEGISVDNESQDPIAELEEAVRIDKMLDETADRMRQFLAERGLVLSMPPEFDFDDFYSTYLAIHPEELDLHPGKTSEEFDQAARDEIDRTAAQRMQVLLILMNVEFLAVKRCWSDAVQKAASPDSDVAEIRQGLRMEVIQSLWLGNMWHTPWDALVDEEFPGTGPTDTDIDGFIREVADEVSSSLATSIEGDQIQAEMTAILEASGYGPEPEDQLTVMRLAFYVMKQRHAWGLNPGRERARFEAGERIRKSRPRSDHPAWKALLDKFFPVG